jgi:hypothetical protein
LRGAGAGDDGVAVVEDKGAGADFGEAGDAVRLPEGGGGAAGDDGEFKAGSAGVRDEDGDELCEIGEGFFVGAFDVAGVEGHAAEFGGGEVGELF